jgi:acetyltransferase-like isoleucine patch superfamily enzyme
MNPNLWKWLSLPFRKFVSLIGLARSWFLFGRLGLRIRIPLSVEIKFPERIEFGEGVAIGPKCTIGAHAPITFGRMVRLSKGVTLETAGLDFSSGIAPYKHVSRPIAIGDGVWIGARAIVLGGVTLGEFSVVGAGSVVTKDVPAYSVVVGNPARVVRSFRPASE